MLLLVRLSCVTGLILLLSHAAMAQNSRSASQPSNKKSTETKQKATTDTLSSLPPAKASSPTNNPLPPPAPPLPKPDAAASAPTPLPQSYTQVPIHPWILGGIVGMTGINTILLLFTLLRPRATNSLPAPVPGSSQNNLDDLHRLSRAFAGLHEALDKKDEEIRRHQKGYDHKILKTLLGRLVQVQLFLEGALSDKPPTQQGVQSVADELAMVLEEYGIRTHEPKGEPYRTTPGVATNPKTVPTDRADLRGRIAEVRQKGFFLKTPAGDEVLLPAKVTIYE